MTGCNKNIKLFPTVDSPNNDAFEAVVEMYYQRMGYITSSGKWFSNWGNDKRQRGYLDIDVLAIGRDSTIIVSVTSNLDDKINMPNGNLNESKLKKLNDYFYKISDYLLKVNEYNWLVENNRKILKVVAYNNGYSNETSNNKIKVELSKNNIELISSTEIFKSIEKYVEYSGNNFKTQNIVLRTLQLYLNSKKSKKSTDTVNTI